MEKTKNMIRIIKFIMDYFAMPFKITKFAENIVS